jgi:hypothetical protein
VIDPPFAIALAGLVPIALGLAVFYRVVLGEHPLVVTVRRSIIARDDWRWPFQDPLPGTLPFGLGILFAALGRLLSGQTVSDGEVEAHVRRDAEGARSIR